MGKRKRRINNPERWITWLVGRRRTQQTARHCVKCRSHEHRHVERTLLARNPGVSGHVHPRVGIDSNMNQYELGSTLSPRAIRVGRQFCQSVVFVTRTRLAWEFFVVSGLTAADLASPEILRRAGTSKECSPVQSNLALWIFVHANTLKPLRLNFVGSFGCQIERVSDPVD
uniref:Uncharacterized protein n=1 Tax=Cacopsylla melanoneura TaxID=428564 RepID=A0A8D8LZQ4_9HEMI